MKSYGISSTFDEPAVARPPFSPAATSAASSGFSMPVSSAALR